MIKVVLVCGDSSLQIPGGESLIGRDVSCRLRFNDSTVSRRHLQLVVHPETVLVADLASRNGTRVNGVPLRGVARLADGDEVHVGRRSFRVQIISVGDADDLPATETDARLEIVRRLAEGPDVSPPPPPPLHAGAVSHQNCPACRASIRLDAETCPSCGHRLPGGRVLSTTQSIDVGALEAAGPGDRRQSPRKPVNVPVLYSSASLTFEAMGRDLSKSGMFVATELLEPVGTHCGLILLPDARSTLHVHGIIRRIVDREDAGQAVGIGVAFDGLDDDAAEWIGETVG